MKPEKAISIIGSIRCKKVHIPPMGNFGLPVMNCK